MADVTAQLLERIAELETENWLLRRELNGDTDGSFDFHIPNRERQVINVLLRASPCWVPKHKLASRVFEFNEPNDAARTIESHVSKARKRLRPYGVTIRCERYTGYAIDRANAHKLRQLMQ